MVQGACKLPCSVVQVVIFIVMEGAVCMRCNSLQTSRCVRTDSKLLRVAISVRVHTRKQKAVLKYPSVIHYGTVPVSYKPYMNILYPHLIIMGF